MVWFLVALSLGIPGAFFSAVLLKRLRIHHPATYAALRSPAFIPDSLSAAPNWTFARFLWIQNPSSIGDSQVTILVWLIRVESVAFAVWCFWPLLLPWPAV